MEEEAPRRRMGIDTIRQAAEMNATCFKLFDKDNKLLQTAPEAIQFPDNQGISFANDFESNG